MSKGLSFIVCGPSGVGKSTILKELFHRIPNLYFSVSATTRAPRVGEIDGVDYHFIQRDDFLRMIKDGELLEHAEFVGNFYGTPKKYVDEAMDDGRDVILDIEVQGAEQVHTLRPETIRIFVLPPSWEILEQRLVGRGTDSQDKVQKRLEQAKKDIRFAEQFDYVIVNNDVGEAVDSLMSIIKAEHCRRTNQSHLLF